MTTEPSPSSSGASGVSDPQHLVLVFDICSSTSVLEDLNRSQSIWRWRQLLADLLNFISDQPGLTVYKFLGDGWFILMPPDTPGAAFISLCSGLITRLDDSYGSRVKPVMENPFPSLGLTIGADSGTLHRFQLGSSTEYVGRPLNVAARLQAAVKAGNSKYQNCGLVTNKVALQLELAASETIEVSGTSRTLSNVTGGEQFACTQVRFRA